MYRIAICEDDALYAKHLSNEVEKCFSELNVSIQTNTFLNAEDFLENLNRYDLYFLDILLGDKNGIDIAKEIQNRYGKQIIIFVSSHESSVFDAIHQSPFRFIRKDKLLQELPEACEAYLNNLSITRDHKKKKTILIKQNQSTILIPIDSIYYIESKGHYIDFICSNETYHIRGGFKDYIDLCESPEFGRCAQSFLVHLKYVTSITANYVTLIDEKSFPLSRSRKKEFQEKYMHYQRLIQYANTF